MRESLGDGYAEVIRATHPDVPASADYVMYWWNKAAKLTRNGQLQRFGLITTNSLRQTFNRRVLQQHMEAKPPISLVFAIPDHPWVDSEEGAAVRISMTVGEIGNARGSLQKVVKESETDSDEVEVLLVEISGEIQPDLTIGANVASVSELQANEGLSHEGVKLHGAGFIVTQEEAIILGLGRISGLDNHIREYRNGRDITSMPRGVMVIDLFGLELREVRERFPEVKSTNGFLSGLSLYVTKLTELATARIGGFMVSQGQFFAQRSKGYPVTLRLYRHQDTGSLSFWIQIFYRIVHWSTLLQTMPITWAYCLVIFMSPGHWRQAVALGWVTIRVTIIQDVTSPSLFRRLSKAKKFISVNWQSN
jgi:hypothetical protein